MKELERVIPNSEVFLRRNSTIKKMVKQCKEKGYTDIIVINEHQKEPGKSNDLMIQFKKIISYKLYIITYSYSSCLRFFLGSLLLCHLPEGPTFFFKLSNVKLTKHIKVNLVSKLYYSFFRFSNNE